MKEWTQKEGTEYRLSAERWLKETDYAKGGGLKKEIREEPAGRK